MHIEIAGRFKPYTHIPGAFCLLPCTALRCQIFPAFIKIESLHSLHPKHIAEIHLNVKGPVEDFTVVQDLEKGCVRIWGHAQQGYFRYVLHPNLGHPSEGDFFIHIEKAYADGLHFNDMSVAAGEVIAVSANRVCKIPHECLRQQTQEVSSRFSERLSLGIHKAQDWSMVHRRQNLGEIMPIWLRLGQSLPHIHCSSEKCQGTAHFLDSCSELIQKKDRVNVLYEFRKLFLAGFEGILSPRLIDAQHQGFSLPSLDAAYDLSPLVLLTEGARLIRSLFIQSNSSEIAVLPVLPVEFHCGRLLNVHCGDAACLDIEWSKKTIRRVVLRPLISGDLNLIFKDVHSYRLKTHRHHPGARMAVGQVLHVEKGKDYFLDNFQH